MPLGFQLAAPFVFSDTTPSIPASLGEASVDASIRNALADAGLEFVRVFGHDASPGLIMMMDSRK